MNVALAFAVVAGIGWLLVMHVTAPQPAPRHPHMAALDRLGRRDEPGRCWSCGAELDAVGGCTGVCDPWDEGDLPW